MGWKLSVWVITWYKWGSELKVPYTLLVRGQSNGPNQCCSPHWVVVWVLLIHLLIASQKWILMRVKDRVWLPSPQGKSLALLWRQGKWRTGVFPALRDVTSGRRSAGSPPCWGASQCRWGPSPVSWPLLAMTTMRHRQPQLCPGPT